MTTGRLEAFSDGVFAIAITLLVLEIKVPHTADDASLARALVNLWPSYAGFVISFLTILIMWMNHHRIFRLVRRVDDWLLLTNGLLLLCVTFIPFPTAVLAENLETSQAKTATIFYSGSFLALALVYNMMWQSIAMRGRLVDMQVDGHLVRAISRQFALGPLSYLATLLLAFINPVASICASLALAAFYTLPGSLFHRPRNG
jgi:uncharacterized membrane protein